MPSCCYFDENVHSTIGTPFAVPLRNRSDTWRNYKMKKLITVLGTIALAVALSSVSFAQQDQSPQTSPSAQPDAPQSGQQPSSPSQDSSSSMQDNQSASFSGTVVKASGKYVLKTADANYQLDDQQKAKQFVGKQVKVSGSLDNSTSTIHVSDITPAS
jgi:uncharacterized protein YdeI (BOF family)